MVLQSIQDHPHLRNSESLEVFLICQTKEEFQLRSKDLNKKIKKRIKITRSMSKKNFEYLKDKKAALKSIKGQKGTFDIKISSLIRKYFTEFGSKMSCFENTFAELEKLGIEYKQALNKVFYYFLFFK